MRRAVSALREGGTWLGRYFVRKWQLLTAVTFALAALAAAAGQGSSVPVQGAALPLSGMVIVVDAGHGGYDGGAIVMACSAFLRGTRPRIASFIAKPSLAQHIPLASRPYLQDFLRVYRSLHTSYVPIW